MTEEHSFRNLHSPYWAALGRFVETYALVEEALFDFVAFLMGVDRRICVAVLAGARTEVLIANVYRLFEVVPVPASAQEELKYALGRFKYISRVRNSVIHYLSGVTQPDMRRTSANTPRALTPSAHTVHEVSQAIMIEHCLDLLKIYDHLLSLEGGLDVPKDVRARDFPGVRDSWRYTIPPNPNQKPRQAKRPKRKKGSGQDAQPEAS